MKFYIGVDGGGTKTAFALFDSTKKMLDIYYGKGSNHENLDGGFEEAADIIIDGIDTLCSKNGFKKEQIAFSLMGLAGIDHKWQHDKMCAMLRDRGLENFEIYNDGYLIIKAGSETGAAVGYNCGTGVCCNGIDSKGNMLQLMGLGVFSGDLSGGQTIAIKAYEIAYRELFLGIEKSPITDMVTEHYGINSREEFLELLGRIENPDEPEHVRNFVGFFFKAVEAGDAHAMQYCVKMADRGAKSIASLVNQMNFEGDEVEVILSGSINVKVGSPTYIKELTERARQYASKKLIFKKLEKAPVTGCINWIMQEYADEEEAASGPREITVAVIGSGSTYCPELIDGFLKAQDKLRLRRIAFMDIDEKKRTIVGNLCIRMLKAQGIDCETLLTDDLDEALKGADFVVTQIRVGKLPARHLDETIPLKYNLIGQETTGIGGFFKAQRTIPVIKHICDRIEAICPDAWLINFTNPSGIITEFVLNNTNVKCIGLCNVPIDMIDDTKEIVGEDMEYTYVGLNHLSWMTSVRVNGKELLDELIEKGFSPKVMANIKDDGFSLETLAAIHALPSSYLQYYYCRNAKLKHLLEGEKSRAQVCMEIEEELLEMYSDEGLYVKPALLDQRGGHKYSLVAVNLINAIANDVNDIQVVNVKNGDTLPFLKPDDVIEVAARVGKDGAKPLPVGEIDNHHIIGLMRVVKEYENYTVKAGRDGDEEAALNALLIHPLVGDWEAATKCFNEMKEAHKDYLPQYFKD